MFNTYILTFTTYLFSLTPIFLQTLQAYLSILYLRLPQDFNVILRGQIVEHHNIADDLKFYDYVLYKPQDGDNEVFAKFSTKQLFCCTDVKMLLNYF